MSSPSRFLSGISTQAVNKLLGDYPLPDPFHTGGNSMSDVITFSTDYTDTGTTAAFTVTGTSSTFTIESGLGGWAVLTPGAATTASSIYRQNMPFQLVSGKKLWFVQRLVPGLFATTGTYAFGLSYNGGTSDGIWFTKPASSNEIRLVSSVYGTSTTWMGTGATTVGNNPFPVVTPVTSHSVGTLAATSVNGSATITYTANTSLLVGQFVYGAGIQPNSQVISIISSTSCILSHVATASGSNTLNYGSAIDVGFYFNGTDLFVYNNDSTVGIFRLPAGTGIGSTGSALTNVLLSPFTSMTPTATDLLHTDYLLTAQEMTR